MCIQLGMQQPWGSVTGDAMWLAPYPRLQPGYAQFLSILVKHYIIVTKLFSVGATSKKVVVLVGGLDRKSVPARHE